MGIPRVNLTPHSESVISSPSIYPVSVADLKGQLRVTDNDEDAMLAGYIKTATKELESLTRRKFLQYTIDEVYDHWPVTTTTPAIIHWAPLSSITHIKYIDTDGNEQTWSSANYTVDTYSEPGRVALAYNGDIPSTQTGIIQVVTIRAVVGYGTTAADTPQLAKDWICAYCQAWYDSGRPPDECDLMALRNLAGPLQYML